MKMRFDDFPSVWEIGSQLFIIYFFDDFSLYWAHRLFHESKFLYKYHKVHHEYDSLYSLVTEHNHPIDYVFGNIVYKI
jgi:sterol desaturase/sphingolipid hydroxylase (fatty acid hydroxylase superfamily)